MEKGGQFMRRAMAILLSICVIFLPACGNRERAPAEYDLIIAADLHYISPRLTDQGPLFTDALDRGTV